jgi:amino acid transporter
MADLKNEKYETSAVPASPIHDHHGDIEQGETDKLHRSLKGRHMQMIAIGGSIGAGLFVGSGGALAKGGPGNLIIDFIIIGIMLLLTVNAMGELAGKLPRITI